MMSATTIRVVPIGARGLPGLGSSSSMPLAGHKSPKATAASTPLAASSHATAHQPRDGGRPDGNSRLAATSKARLAYQATAESQAAALPKVDPDPSARASTAIRAAMPASSPKSPAPQYNQPMGKS